jgi:hypothetical protein
VKNFCSSATSGPLDPSESVRVKTGQEEVEETGDTAGWLVGTVAPAHEAIAASVLGPTVPQPVVCGEPEETTPCADCQACTAVVVSAP